MLGDAPLGRLAVGVGVPVAELDRELVNVPVDVGTVQAMEPVVVVMVPPGQGWHAALLGAPDAGLKVLRGHTMERAEVIGAPPGQ